MLSKSAPDHLGRIGVTGLVVLATSCGRLGFDPLGSGDSGIPGGDGAVVSGDGGASTDANPLVNVELTPVGTWEQLTQDNGITFYFDITPVGEGLAITFSIEDGNGSIHFTRLDGSASVVVDAVAINDEGSVHKPRVALANGRIGITWLRQISSNSVKLDIVDLTGTSLLPADLEVTPSSTLSLVPSVESIEDEFYLTYNEEGTLTVSIVDSNGLIQSGPTALFDDVQSSITYRPGSTSAPGSGAPLCVYWDSSAGGEMARLGADLSTVTSASFAGAIIHSAAAGSDTTAVAYNVEDELRYTDIDANGDERLTRVVAPYVQAPFSTVEIIRIGSIVVLAYQGTDGLLLTAYDNAGTLAAGPISVVAPPSANSPRLWWTGTELRLIYIAIADGDRDLFLQRFQVALETSQ